MASRSPQKVFENPTVAVTLDDLTDSPSRDTVLTVLSEDQTEFLDAVRDGDHARVREYILERSVDVNCVNLLGETALQIAVSNNRHEIAKFLLNEGADVGNALLYAVANESTVWVTLLLDFIEDLNAQSHATTAGTSRNQEASKASEDHCYTKYISSLVLAAQSNNQEIVKILLEKGYTIEEPSFHRRSCKCGECEGKRLGSSIHRLHSYRALASPVYLCLSYLLDRSPNRDQDIKSSKDPIICAFLLNRKLENLMDEEYELKNDYQALSSACEEFAVSLLTKCRSMEEIGCLMSVPGIEKLEHVEVRGGREAQKLSVLNFAIANKNEKFVAHPYSQMMLNSVLYDKLGGWEDHNFLNKALFCLLLCLLLPALALCYFVAPNSRISKLLKTPVFKFLSHTASSFWFLVLLVLSSIQDKFSNLLDFAPLDVFIMLWIAGMLFQEAKEAYRQGKERYVSQYWNLLTLFMLGLFIASGVLWLSGFFLTVSGKKTWVLSVSDVFGTSSQEIAYRLILLSNAFFSFGMVLAFVSFSNAFQVNSVLGPLQLSLVKMVRDIAKFLFLFLLLFLAFGWAERKVYSHYVQAREAFVGNATEHEFASIGGSLRLLFWDLFGMADLEDLKTDEKFAITQFTGELLLGLYSIGSILVAINMLIAMMTNSYQQVADDADIQWKFSRTRMWMPYLDQGNAMPPPFNLIPPPHLVIQLCRRLCRGAGYYEHQSCQGRSATPIKDKVDLDKRHKVMTRLIQRYLLTVNKSKSQSHAAPESEAVSLDENGQLRGLLIQLQDFLKKNKDRKDSSVARV